MKHYVIALVNNLYRLHFQQKKPIELVSIASPPQAQIRHRAYSFSFLVTNLYENERMTRSLSSLNCILYR